MECFTRETSSRAIRSARSSPILEGTIWFQRIGQFATERRGVSLQCREADIAFGFGPLGVHDGSLGDPHGLGQLARGHAQCLSYRTKPATVRPGAWQRAPRAERLVELL